MTDLTGLRARIEAVKEAALSVEPWSATDREWSVGEAASCRCCSEILDGSGSHLQNSTADAFFDDLVAEHIAAHDPASVIRDADADLALLDAITSAAGTWLDAEGSDGNVMAAIYRGWFDLALANLTARYPASPETEETP